MKKKLALFLSVVMLLTFQPVASKGLVDLNLYATQVTVTQDVANIYAGPGTSFPIIANAEIGTILECHGLLNGWYLVQISAETTGLLKADSAEPTPESIKPLPEMEPEPEPEPAPVPEPPKPEVKTPEPTSPPAPANNSGLTQQEEDLLWLVNQERRKEGLKDLTVDPTLTNLARLKSQDMVNLNYFSHTSPTYGSPFDMMKANGVRYRSAGENLAAYYSVQSAHDALMKSPGHRENIMDPLFTHVGLGIVDSPRYGLMVTQMFIQK